MKTSVLLTTLLFVGLFSCEDKTNISPATVPTELSSFKTSSQFNAIAALFPDIASNLNFSKIWNEDFNGTKIYAIPSEISGKTIGVLHVDKNFRAVVESRSFSKSQVTLQFKQIDGTEIVSWTGTKIGNSYSFSYKDLMVKYSNQKSSKISCTTSSCYATAKAACASSGQCSMMCDLLPTCSASIAVACWWTCAFT